MTIQIALALTAFAFVTSITPGPNNMMLMASGANFGLRRTIPHMLGVALGFGAMIALLGLGMDKVIADHPRFMQVLYLSSIIYVFWLAWKIATAAAPGGRAAGAAPMSFLQACAFQWVNPKAWAMALGALSAYATDRAGVALVVVIFVLVNLPSVAVWAVMGQRLGGWLQNPGRLMLFNRAMALLLVASMLPVILN